MEPERERPGLLAELSRRRVFRVAAVYAAVGFVLVQVANNFFPALHLPAWTTTLVAVLVVLGFPVALVLAWALELTPEGVRRTPSADQKAAGSPPPGVDSARAGGGVGGWTAQRIAAAGGALVLALAGAAFLITGRSEETTPVSEPSPARSIAILPFVNLSADAENEPLADGITEDIRGRLSRLGDLRVTSRTSAMTYKGSARTAREIGQELGVAYLLEGTVQRSGDRLRVAAQLVDAGSDETHWSDTFDRRLTDVFDIQAEIAERIAGSLRIRLSPGDRARLGRGQTQSVAAYELYLKGVDFLRNPPGGLAEARSTRLGAIALLRQAVALDPEFALPHAALAWAYDEHPDLSKAERLDSARVISERVIRMAPELPDGYAELGWYHLALWHPEPAGRQFRLALERDPNHEFALGGMQRYHFLSGRMAEAMEYARRAVEVAPTDGWNHDAIGAMLAAVGDFVGAEEWYRRAWFDVRGAPDRGYCQLMFLAHYREDRSLARARLDTLLAADPGEYGLYCAAFMEFEQGEWAAAERLLDRGARAPHEDDGEPRLLRAAIAVRAGDPAWAEALLREAEARALERWRLCDGRCYNHTLARIRALQGRGEEALDHYRQAFETGWDEWYPAVPDPFLSSIEEDPGYRALRADWRERMDAERSRLEALSR